MIARVISSRALNEMELANPIAPNNGATHATKRLVSDARNSRPLRRRASPCKREATTNPNTSVAVLQFMPTTVKVNVGTPVRWSWAGDVEPHSVTFLPPGQQTCCAGLRFALFTAQARPEPEDVAYCIAIRVQLQAAGPAGEDRLGRLVGGLRMPAGRAALARAWGSPGSARDQPLPLCTRSSR